MEFHIRDTPSPARRLPKACRSPRYPAGWGTSRSRPPWTCTATWCPRPAGGHATHSTGRSLVRACAPKVPRRPLSNDPGAAQGPVVGVSRPVGRVLCPRWARAAVIHLGLSLPTASCGLPASIGRAALERSRRPAPRSGAGPFDLAPGGVYRAAAVTCGAGGLLHHRFTLTSAPANERPRRFVFCGTVPRVTPGRRYRPPCPAEPGPSSPGR